ncbi:MAG: ATP-binding protein [Clostridia bacterium]|nr:ATP-binding protein [Clostridia bacterium]
MIEKFKNLYTRLCLVSVFRGALTHAPFTHLIDYFKSTTIEEKMNAYAKMINGVYEQGRSFTDFVEKVVFEDENAFIKAHANAQKPHEHLLVSAQNELRLFEEIGALTPEDFAQDMKTDGYVLPRFDSERRDFVSAYDERLNEISKYGYGIFTSYTMFRLSDDSRIEPIVSADKIAMDSFIGYEEERGKVVANTQAFISGRPAANVLLCGDAGTGKSSTVKAVANAFFDKGVRLIELRKDQLHYLPFVMGKISGNPLKFIIFIDDLSFNQNDDNFSMLKAALEGSASAKADNAVIYATSNRRHIIKESFGDRTGDDVHVNDTLQETLSLSERFGLTVLFQKPNKKLYLDIVHALAQKHKIEISESELDIKAEAFALKKGNRSARCAEQFIDSLL